MVKAGMLTKLRYPESAFFYPAIQALEALSSTRGLVEHVEHVEHVSQQVLDQTLMGTCCLQMIWVGSGISFWSWSLDFRILVESCQNRTEIGLQRDMPAIYGLFIVYIRTLADNNLQLHLSRETRVFPEP